MRILGVDPGIAVTGYALIDIGDRGTSPIDYGFVETDRKADFSMRLKRIHDELIRVIEQYHPNSLALEQVFYSRNVQVALKLGHARGVVLLAAVSHGMEIIEYAPREIKQSVTGNGAASKHQVQRMVQQLLGLRELPEPNDVSDAMAAALCHSFRFRLK